MLDTMKNRSIGPDEVRDKFGVPPDKVVDVQALAGDSTDNVPGVPGIGVKTAAELINEYGDLDTLLERAGEIKQAKRRERLIEFALQARLSRELVRLKDDVPVGVSGRAARAAGARCRDAARLPARDGVLDADQAHRRGPRRGGPSTGRAQRWRRARRRHRGRSRLHRRPAPRPASSRLWRRWRRCALRPRR